jgi:hypothetical protein
MVAARRKVGLNVVGVAADEHPRARYGVRRRERGMDDCGVRQPRRPGVEFLTVRDSERQMVQARGRFVEHVLAPAPMLGEPSRLLSRSRSIHHPWVRTILFQRETIWKLAGFRPELAKSGMCHRQTLGWGSPGA